MSNCNFEWELALSVGVIFFMWDLKTFFIKYSEYESQTKKVIPNVVSTISHFLSPTLTTLWLSVFLSLFSLVYTPPPPPLTPTRLGKFQIFWALLFLGDLISFLAEEG